MQGASRGIGLELVRQLLATQRESRVFASCRSLSTAPELLQLRDRHPGRLVVLAIDVAEEETIAKGATQVAAHTDRLHLILNVAGVLHGVGFSPEKKLAHVRPEALQTVFAVNAFGPLLIAKHFHELLRHGQRSVFASLSARVGSISDNRLGGWYAYRGSKAAQNMFTKTLSIELGRIAPKAIVIGLHPGTVDTDLSKPFQARVPKSQLLPTADSANSLLRVIDTVSETDSGRVFDYRGDAIPP